MRRTQVSPNNYTFPFVFRVCASSEAGSLILLGRVVHGEAVRAGFDSDLHVEAALVHMYAKWGDVIEFGEEIHGFHTADREHPYWEEVYREVEILAVKLKMAGHVPDLSCTLHDMEEEDKELALNLHSEKLAVAFGIMRTESGMTIYLTKNLRVCNDCHSALKFLSHIFDREIVVRDGNRFHHFKGGVCSCNDYW
ncbi:unnamed protein product [Linum tenue]|uniref:DYW domain-containing protein n=1 Tax=Linum tenue TaxID=586396 RepID=A0AAV0MUN1_9ROSI|nr:unnamed protein product [Linum tenue]